MSLRVVQRIALTVGLDVDVEELHTHGGSLRVWLAHRGVTQATSSVEKVLSAESAVGLETLEAYAGFQQRAEAAKNRLLEFLSKPNSRVDVYWATELPQRAILYLIMLASVRPSPAVVDRAPSKGYVPPGSHISVISPNNFHSRL